jgi:hypothetical protein
MQMFMTSEKAKPDEENIRGLKSVAVKHTTVQVSKFPQGTGLLSTTVELGYNVIKGT